MRPSSFSSPEVRVFPDAEAVAVAAAEAFARAAERIVAERGAFYVALSGGSTPRAVYAKIAEEEVAGRRKLPWAGIHVFFGDERCVPPDHAESNYRMASESLLDHVPLPPANLHRIRGELPPATAATAYEADLRRYMPLQQAGMPRFDFLLLGVGPDGHTASLFPGSAALAETTRAVVASEAPMPPVQRVTLTLPVLNNSASVLFLVLGGEKAAMLRQVLRTDTSGAVFPAQRVRPVTGCARWYLDEAAASQLAKP